MKKDKKIPQFKQHLKNYIMIALALFTMLLGLNSIALIFQHSFESIGVDLSNYIYYLGIFISIMMLVMSLYYLRSLKYLKIK